MSLASAATLGGTTYEDRARMVQVTCRVARDLGIQIRDPNKTTIVFNHWVNVASILAPALAGTIPTWLAGLATTKPSSATRHTMFSAAVVQLEGT